jgi:hypothetical protein
MSSHEAPEIRALSAEEVDATAGGAIHLHVPGLFHLAIGPHGASIGVFGVGVGVDDSEGAFTFTFD